MTVFILFVIAMFDGQPNATYRGFPDLKSCEAAKELIIKQALQAGVTDLSANCTEHKVGKIA